MHWKEKLIRIFMVFGVISALFGIPLWLVWGFRVAADYTFILGTTLMISARIDWILWCKQQAREVQGK